MEYSLIITNTVKSGIQHRSGIIKTDISQQTFVLMKTSSRRLDEDEYILINHKSSEDVFKTSSRRLGQDQCIRLVHTSSRRLQDVFKTSSRRLQDIFKTYHQVKLFLLTRL